MRLGSPVHIRETARAVEFNHVGLKRVVDVPANTENRDIGGVAADIERALKPLELPAGIKVESKGEYARMTESAESLGVGLASVLVYLLMVPLMRSFVMPMVIMAAVPLGADRLADDPVGDRHHPSTCSRKWASSSSSASSSRRGCC